MDRKHSWQGRGTKSTESRTGKLVMRGEEMVNSFLCDIWDGKMGGCCKSWKCFDLLSFFTGVYIIQGSWGKSWARTWDYQPDDTIFLRPSPVSRVTTGSVDESGGPVQLLRPDESWLVGGMVERLHSSTRAPSGRACLSSQPTFLQHSTDSYSSDPHGELKHQVQGDLSKLWKCSLFMLLCTPPPPTSRTELEMWH